MDGLTSAFQIVEVPTTDPRRLRRAGHVSPVSREGALGVLALEPGEDHLPRTCVRKVALQDPLEAVQLAPNESGPKLLASSPSAR